MTEEAEREASERKAGIPRCALVTSKTVLRCVEGGACDFYTIRLNRAPEADVMVQIDDPTVQVRSSPKVVRFAVDAAPGEVSHRLSFAYISEKSWTFHSNAGSSDGFLLSMLLCANNHQPQPNFP